MRWAQLMILRRYMKSILEKKKVSLMNQLIKIIKMKIEKYLEI